MSLSDLPEIMTLMLCVSFSEIEESLKCTIIIPHLYISYVDYRVRQNVSEYVQHISRL